MHWRSLRGQRGQVTLKPHSSVIHGTGVLERAVQDWHTPTGHRWAVKWVKILNATLFQCHHSAKNVSSLLACVVVMRA